MQSTAAGLFLGLTVLTVLFQIGLAIGLPWGKASMGGRFPGKYPPRMRWVALINALVLAFTATVVLAEAGCCFAALRSISGVGIWVVIAFYALGTVLNLITPSKIERIWAPVVFIQTICATLVALA